TSVDDSDMFNNPVTCMQRGGWPRCNSRTVKIFATPLSPPTTAVARPTTMATLSAECMSTAPKIVGKKLRIAPHCKVYDEKIMPKAHGNGVFTKLLIKRLIRVKLIAPELSSVTLCTITGINSNVALANMTHQTST